MYKIIIIEYLSKLVEHPTTGSHDAADAGWTRLNMCQTQNMVVVFCFILAICENQKPVNHVNCIQGLDFMTWLYASNKKGCRDGILTCLPEHLLIQKVSKSFLHQESFTWFWTNSFYIALHFVVHVTGKS